MRLSDTIHLSLESFKNRKSRTLLTILGVGVGIAAVLFLVSLGYGLQQILLERITTAESFLTLDVTPADNKVIALNQDTLEKISRLPNVEKVSPQASFTAQVAFESLAAETAFHVIDRSFFVLNGVLPSVGRDFEANDSFKTVVNLRVAELFNVAPEQMLGKKLRFVVFMPTTGEESTLQTFEVDKDFEIVGLIEEGELPQVYVLGSDVPVLPITEYQFAKVKVSDSKFLDAAREQLLGMGLVVSAISDVVDQANKIFGIIQIVLGIFGVIAVIVAAISLANTMTISLLERTQDIGVMRAIGASKKDIRNLFLIESTLIGFSGGLLGIMMGMIIAETFNFALKLLAQSLGSKPVDLFFTPGWFMLFIMIFSTSVGFITGILPARRAARLNPLRALRYK
ncbi:MAG: ABC transporter permease [Candidatus Doudnabacteria bacterium]|nr:ABC transporter permease [Candidatus Doudnabacteria bacterium]